MEKIEFANTDISSVLDRLPPEDINRLPFGLVKLDSQGTILQYNIAEASITGIKPEDVIGKNFFLDVAVCTQRPEFYGRFREAMDHDRVLNLIFDYTFQNALYAPVHEPIKVRVHMVSSRDTDGRKIVWLMVKRVAAGAEPNSWGPVAAGPRAGVQPDPVRSSEKPADPSGLGDIAITFDDL
ncbi:MAG: PAS domain-containing protein [Casimicrobiaceae bacterium]